VPIFGLVPLLGKSSQKFFIELKKTLLSGEDCLSVQKAAPGDEVTVHYESRLKSNGVKFDSSFDRGEPITFELGTNLVVQGWEQGLPGTCPNQTIKLEVPSNLGYGREGAGDVIPANADLVFEIKLEAVKSRKVKIDIVGPKPCTKDKQTQDNDIVVFNYVGYFENGKFYSV
jgi:FKBP-type peptidyl-prolyl cis-trans isomerase